MEEKPPPIPVKINLGIRILSMVIDHFIMSIIMVLLLMPELIPQLLEISKTPENPAPVDITNSMIYMFAFGYALYFFKDAIQGQSLAKRILKLQVIDLRTGVAASPIKCVLRNILIPLWFIEIPMVIFNPKRRLGDYLAGTAVVPFQSNESKPPINIPTLLVALLLAIGFASMLLSNLREILDVTINGVQ